LIEAIESDVNATAFLEPVPWQEYELNDYPDIIKNPMDLGTVKSKMLKGEYQSYEECFGDIQLIWDNCKLYNMAGSDIYKLAERMEKTSRRELQKFRSAHNIPQLSVVDKNSSKKRSAGRAGRPKPEQVVQDSYQEERKTEDPVPVKMKETNKAIVSVDMKMDLVHKIKKLHDEGLTKTVNRIAQLMESSMSEMENDHVQIRIDDFDMPTFKAVLDFVEDILMNE